MNFYHRHLGDYSKNASHLSLLEHGVYVRLIDVYYTREAPIPDDKAARWIGAATEPETLALQVVLQEFFQLREGHWHQDRCDAEIAAYVEGEPEREVKKANEDNRLKRHRDERAALFRVLVDAGRHAPWNIGIVELRQLAAECVAGVAVPEASNGPATKPATATATPATATHYPLPNTQYPLKEKRAPGAIAPSSPAKQATLLLPGLSVVPSLPAAIPPCPHRDLLAMFVAAVPEMPRPRVESWSGKNADAMRARWRWVLTARRESGESYATSSAEALAWFDRFFKVVAASDFLCGRVDGRSKFTLGWLMKKENFDKVMEHGYPNRETA